MKCATCRRELNEGSDVFQVEEGIVGLSGFVPLDDAVVFCSVECLKEYFKASRGYDRWKAPDRVP